MSLTYLQIHLFFTLPITVVLAVLAPRYDPPRRRSVLGIAVLVAIAFAYTTPWGSYLIGRGVWWYGDGVVLVSLLSIPLGEYLFFVIQTVIVALFLHVRGFDPAFREGDLDRRPRLIGGAAGLGVCAVGVGLLLLGPSTLYLGALLAWVGPVFAVQWVVGGGYLRRTPGVWLSAALVPSAYLWVVDRFAIEWGVWVISERYTTGVAPLGLPIEEALFFLFASLMTVKGLVLFEWVLDWNDRRTAGTAAAAGTADE